MGDIECNVSGADKFQVRSVRKKDLATSVLHGLYNLPLLIQRLQLLRLLAFAKGGIPT